MLDGRFHAHPAPQGICLNSRQPSAFAPSSSPPPSGARGPWCAMPSWRRRRDRRATSARTPTWPASIATGARPRSSSRAPAPCGPPGIAAWTGGSPLRSDRARPRSWLAGASPPKPCPAQAAADGRLTASPWTGRSRSPASPTALRACRRERDGSLLARTPRPGSRAPSPRPCLAELVAELPSRAWAVSWFREGLLWPSTPVAEASSAPNSAPRAPASRSPASQKVLSWTWSWSWSWTKDRH
jgi:hypothetical protein